MANRNFGDVQALGHDYKIVAGSFKPNGTGAVTNADNTGYGFSVARTAAGDFTITLEDGFDHVVSALCSIAHPTDVDLTVQWKALTAAAATRTFLLTLLAAATPTDMAADAAARVHFCLILANSAVNPR